LVLGRYGHLSDIELHFPLQPALHIVLGENEAGKSTALAAIGDGLFGFPHRTNYAFLHATRDLRIGLGVRSADGRQGTFFRRKGRKDDLVDEADQPVPESALAAFLSGATRERFDRVFGLNGAELRQGGEAILKFEGEVGESILQAHTGLHGFRALVDRLDHEAGRLFGDRRGRRELHVAVDAFKAAKEQLDQRTVEPAAFKQTRDEAEQLEQALATNAQEAQVLRTGRSRLDRIRRTAPARRALMRAMDERAALGEVPALPPDADTRRQAAVAERERSARDLARERARDADLAAALEALVVDQALLAEGDAIDLLIADQSAIVGAERDRQTQRVIVEQCQRNVEETGRRLGLSANADTLAAGIPDAIRRERASKASKAHGILSHRLTTARDARTVALAALTDARDAVAAQPETAPSAELRAAIDAVKAEGRIDTERSDATAACAAAQAALIGGLASLPLWGRDADSLAAAPVPLDSVVARHASGLRTAEDSLLARQRDVADRDVRLAEIAADLTAAVASGELPTQDAIRTIRQRRDQVWQTIRHCLSDGDMTAAAGLPDTLETLVRDADALADRRMTEQERVVGFEQLRARSVREAALRAAANAQLTEAETARAAVIERWRELWQPAGIEPLDPAAMQEWLHKRSAILALRQRAEEAGRRLSQVEARHKAAWSMLADLLPAEAAAAGTQVGALLRAAERVCRERETREASLQQARNAVETARSVVTNSERTMARVEAELAAWNQGWTAIAASLGLSADLPAEAGEQALELWNDIDRDVRRWRAADDRVEEMTARIDGFMSEAADIAKRVAPDLAEIEPHQAIRTMARRLGSARAAWQRLTELTAERTKTADEIRRHIRAMENAENTLAGLRALAGAEDDAALQSAIARASAFLTLSEQISEREAELRPLDDGKSLAELQQEAEGLDVDALPGRIAEIDERLQTLNQQDLASTSRLTELRAVLRDMAQGHDAAGASQQMHDALAEIDDIAGRYVRLRLAHTLLRSGIDRFRRQQQGPLLGRAGQIFARLTEGRYDRLGVDDSDDGRMALVAFRPDGTECPADRLSEGTRDQLYLALRLAAIENHAARTEPLPFIADDLLVNFDDRRARAALRVLAEFGKVTQTILFTHHTHIAELAQSEAATLHKLPPDVVLAAA
jgi:uncharacterized protein YhaN